ncbi:ribosomal RNA small subunit methyltransferase NEP1-like [Octopus vulgaris]|uniref:Ribosomal RNA small subunit methyltransferase NEP1-like n=1 Tax=Octopus vulgaris TaxID=6645 RepID=A0AA36AH52_OCTVU|nr:ribosomal RNA small subunit methyltransferase NEP1-like [Octopus vulgaris]
MSDSSDHEEDERSKTIIKLAHSKRNVNKRRLIVVLENSSLEIVKIGKQYELLNCDKHRHLGKKFKKDMSSCRPDITHQCLLMLMDSPLNRANLLQVYVHTEKNVLIEINPQTRIPRTFERFSGLMVQLLHRLSVHASDGPQKLLKVIKNPINDHLPVGCTKLTMSFSAPLCKDVKTLVPEKDPIVFVIGAMAHGSVDVDYTEKSLSISSYPLSGALTCAKVCSAFEDAWGIV